MLTMWNDYCLVKQVEKNVSNVIITNPEKLNCGVVFKAPHGQDNLVNSTVHFNYGETTDVFFNNQKYLAVKLSSIICVE